MAQWEYKVVVHKMLTKVLDENYSHDLERSRVLDSYGALGWELVALMNQSYRRDTDPTALYGYSIVSYFFKRPVQHLASHSQS